MRLPAAALLAILPAIACADLVDQPEHGVRLERGFRITPFSDEQLADDIWCMTLNPRGEVVVSGAGYISTLLDTDSDGRADKAVKFATMKGAMGLCFDESGKQLLVMGDGWLSEYRDDNLDRVADGPPRQILPFGSGEHGGHAIKRGADGWFWVIAGNDGGVKELHDGPLGKARGAGSDRARRKASAGALLRISPELARSEVVADGFRNPYSFDFNDRGDVFTYDSDCERDYFLPWYSGCRVYHVRLGRHHGWRLPGYTRSLRVPDYMPETVPALSDLGRGSPTAVHCYRGAAFPKHYQGGVFVCDWTFGRVHYLPLIAEGESYVTRAETFLEPVGTHGFAPTGMVETKDGALFVSIGGRKTRGAVYRIEADKKAAAAAEAPVVLPIVPTPPPPALAELAQIQAKLGGWRLDGASAEAFVPYEPVKPDGLTVDERKTAIELAQRSLVSVDDRVHAEAARVLAMLEDNSALAADNLLHAITEKSTPTSDFHYLACLARLKLETLPERRAACAHAILDLDRKLAGGDRRPKQQWPTRLNEVVARLIERDPALADALLAGFSRAGHLAFADVLPKRLRTEAAQKFFALVKSQPDFEWSAELVNLVGEVPDALPLLRGQWKNLGLRPAIRKVLARNPTPEDAALLAEPTVPTVPLESISEFTASLKTVPWEKADIAAGEKLFQQRACAACHAGTSPLGPEVGGPATRLSPTDLMVDIQFPSRNVADAFRATTVQLKDGTQRHGFVVFFSADGILLKTGPGVTERLPQEQIVSSEFSSVSLMPPALLTGLKPRELADLYAYMRSLQASK